MRVEVEEVADQRVEVVTLTFEQIAALFDLVGRHRVTAGAEQARDHAQRGERSPQLMSRVGDEARARRVESFLLLLEPGPFHDPTELRADVRHQLEQG